MAEIVIRAEHLSKYYRLGVINNGTLFRDIQTWIALKRGKTDPHSKIDENKFIGTADGFWALKDLNFEIKQGDRVGIIGKNGAGKSTLLKILSRITAPTVGCVKIRGRVASLLEVGTGFHGELTGRENIYLNGAILGMKKKEVDRKMDEIIDFSEIEQHIDTPVKRYSSGMYVRLAFAVAAHLDSEILIADEVLAVGDIAFQKKALGKMNELSSGQGRTVLFVSHNMAAIKTLCNQGLILEKGCIKFTSSNISDVIEKYNYADEKTDKITDFIEQKDSSISIKNIMVNGKEEACISFNADEKFNIKIQGYTEKTQTISMEIRIKNELGNYLAYYSPGHFLKNPPVIPKGNFEITETLEIANIISGRYFIDLYLISPGIKELLYAPNAMVLNITGVQTVSGVILNYNNVGFINIHSEKKNKI